MLPHNLKFAVEAHNQAFDAHEHKPGSGGALQSGGRGGPATGRQLRDQAILSRTERDSIGAPKQQLTAAIQDQDLLLAVLIIFDDQW